MFLTNVVKWTENVLESVDQKVASVTKTDDVKEETREPRRPVSRSSTPIPVDKDEIIITEKDLEFIPPKKNELKGEELTEKKLQDALDYTRKYFDEKDVVTMTMNEPVTESEKKLLTDDSTSELNESYETLQLLTISVEEASAVDTRKLADENKYLKHNLTHLHDEVKELNRINDLLSSKYKDVVKQVQSKEMYSRESQDVRFLTRSINSASVWRTKYRDFLETN